MTEASRRKQDSEEERVGRVWGSGAWGDILPTVFQFLPPQDRFLVQRVSRLFQRTSEPARLAVGKINLQDKLSNDYKFAAKILYPSASEGIISLRIPSYLIGFGSYWLFANESRLENLHRKCKEALAKLSLPTLRHVSLCTGPLTQSLLPFLRSHPSISSLELSLRYGTKKLTEEVEMIAEGLSGAKIRQLKIRDGDFDNLNYWWSASLFANAEELSLHRIELRNLHFLPDPSKLTSLHYEIYPDHGITNAYFLDQASGLRCLALTFWGNFDIEFAKKLGTFPLESLHFHLSTDAWKTGDVSAIVENLSSGGETYVLARSLQELTMSFRHPENFEYHDMSVFNIDAFLDFPRLHSLRLRMETTDGRVPMWNALLELPVFARLKRRLRVLEILRPDPGFRELWPF